MSRGKKALFGAAMLVLVLAGVEALAWAGGRLAFGERFSRARLAAHRAALAPRAGGMGRPAWLDDEVLHPYLGFVPRRHLEGRLGVSDAPPRASADEVVIAVVGGSVAYQFARDGLPRLIERLRELPRFRGRTLVPMNVAGGGYKAPQQLMMVAYLTALGARPDVLIALDGFNDVALHPTEDAPARVFPAYPRRWHQRVEGMLSRDEFRAMLRRLTLEDRRRHHAGGFSRLPFRALNTTNLVYLFLDTRLEAELAEVDRELLAIEGRQTTPLAATGPRVDFESPAERRAFLADLWRRSSQAIHALTAAHGVRYYHFLQPNQYVPRSKPIGPDEARVATRNASYARTVEASFPLLREAGRTLAAGGVRFHDLTGAFAGHPEPLYVDSCCHFNASGNRILADLIYDTIARDFAQ